ncbi:CMRF35-like molecule 8 isoform X3 [Salvelinus fontinalis]|uniref:CMRF35-like molecule 8 isoform X3 n=1 Tax=Salvelinus fontinalis TaxID=8038 RepID=UPI0024859FA7|nr:CMRF35-like molecule 8 isoform X3 [Salvelinus fontinalis]
MRNLMSVNISLLCAVSCVMSSVITKRGKEGGHSSIQCPYDRGFETNQKYLSKGIWAYRVDVIKTQTHQHPASTHEGRFSLFDNTERRVFTVTITNLILEDSGTYGCEINTWWWYHKTEVRLTVDRAPVPPNPGSVTSRPLLSTTHPSTNITMTTDSSNSTAARTNGTVGTTTPPTDMTRTQGDVMFSGVGLGVVLLLLGLLLFMFFRQRRDRDRRPTASKHSARLLVSDSMTTNQDPDTGTITNPIYATGTNHNPDTACDIITIYAKATNPHPDDIYSNVGGGEAPDSVTYATVNIPRDPA